MKQKFKNMTLTEMVTGIVVLIISLLGIVIYVSISDRVSEMVRETQDKNINREIRFIDGEIVSNLEIVEIMLQDIASNPIVTQAALQPEYTFANLKDYLDELKVLNRHYDLAVFNYAGELVYSNSAVCDCEHQKSNWYEKIVQQGALGYKGTTNVDGSYYWTIAVPITYNEAVEGVLLTKIPIHDIVRFLDSPQYMDGFQMEILKDDVSILKIGDIEQGQSYKGNLSELGVETVFLVDQTDTIKLISDLRATLLLVIVSFIIIAVVILIYASKIYIINPIMNLKKVIEAYMNDGLIPETGNTVAVAEINDLTRQYAEMTQIILSREEALIVSEQTLIKKNTKLKALLKELESTQAMIIQQEKLASIGRLAAGVAHELNSPIGFVNGNFDVLQEYVPTLMSYIEYLKTGENKEEVNLEEVEYILEDIPVLLTESNEGFVRIIEIVKNLKDYARIDVKKSDAYDLNNGVKTTLMIARNEYKYVAEIVEDYGNVEPVQANGSKINEVILNLIVNAVHALEDYESVEEKRIVIRTYNEDGYACCAISDNGPGISEENMYKIFDPFFTTKEPGKGTGLGLNIAYNIIKKEHDGELLVESTINEGTTFIIKLPK